MKKVFVPIAALALGACLVQSCSKGGFSLEGNVAPSSEAKQYYVYLTDEKYDMAQVPVDTISIVDGKFLYSKDIKIPAIARIQQVNGGGAIDNNFVMLPLVPGENAVIDIDGSNFTVKGSDFYMQYNSVDALLNIYKDQMKALVADMYEHISDTTYLVANVETKAQEIQKKAYDDVMGYLKNHNDEEGSVMASIMLIGDIDAIMEIASDRVKNGRFAPMFKAILDDKNSMEE